jgi:hypothetical protein
MGRLHFQANLGKKNSQKPHLIGKKLGVLAHLCLLRDSEQLNIGGLKSRPAWAKSETVSPK